MIPNLIPTIRQFFNLKSISIPIIIIVDNGFPEIYHPSKEKINLCMENRLLLLSPWKYRYRLAEVGISVAECKTMNCVAQALCRKKDDWWKQELNLLR